MIRGLEARARLPRLGVIRLGVKAVVETRNGPRELPREVEYFVLPEELKPLLGQTDPYPGPTAIKVLFPSDDLRLVMPSQIVRYDGGLLGLTCDGETAIQIPPKGPEQEFPCLRPPYIPGKRPRPCQCGGEASARLNVIIVKGPAGIYQVLIGGFQRIADLYTQLEMFRAMFGRLTGIPFTLERIAQQAQIRNDKDERISRTGWPVVVRSPFTSEQALAVRGQRPDELPKALPASEPEEEMEPESGLHAAEVLDRPGVEEPQDAEWDISMAYHAATELGLDPSVYGRYLDHAYGDRDNLGPPELAAERGLFEKAETPAAKAQRKHAIIVSATTPRPGGPVQRRLV